MEQRDQQSSTQPLGYHATNISCNNGKTWKDGNTFLNRWMRLNVRAQNQKSVFNNLLLHVNEETLKEAFTALDGTKAVGVDGVTKSAYGKRLNENLMALENRIKNGSYRPQPKREILIPKPNGDFRPLEVACFEDKIVDWVISKIMTQVFEPSFIRNSFGFRPNKSAHQAIEACYYSLMGNKRPHVVEIDFSKFFNTIPHKKLMKMVEKKIADQKFLGLIWKFLKTPAYDGKNGKLRRPLMGTPQGGLMSPILANIYLNEVVDQWFIQKYGSYKNIIVRYADDGVFLFKKENEAEKFLDDFKHRVTSFGLSLNVEKTKIVKLEKYSSNQFDFLGFTFYWGKQNGKALLKVKTQKNKLLASIREFYHWIKQNRSRFKLTTLWKLAKSKIQGHINYFGYWMNGKKINHFYTEALRSLFKWLNRRSQKLSYTWSGFKERVKNYPLSKSLDTLKLKKLGRTYVSDFLHI